MAESALRSFFDIDQSIGRDVTFQVEVKNGKEECSNPITISLIRPDEDHTPEIDNKNFTCSFSNFRMFRYNQDLAETGRWVYKITPHEDLDSLSVKVESKSRHPNTDPIMTKCWISTGGQALGTPTDLKLAVVAEVTQGSKPVVGARVKAEIERPMDSNGEIKPPVILELMDNGAGADKIKNDGTYSRYFAKYTGKGRYSVKCQVSGDDDTGVNGGFIDSRVFPQKPDPHTPLCCGSDAMPPESSKSPTGNFTRQAAGGAFQVTTDVDPNTDITPPGRVTDLRVTNLPDVIRIEFTAPGDDLDSNDIAKEYVVKFSSTAGNLTRGNFDSEEFNTVIKEEDLVSSNLSPVEGGTTKVISIKTSLFTRQEKKVLAMKAIDAAGNQSPVSNIGQIYLPSYLLLPTTTNKPVTTTKKPNPVTTTKKPNPVTTTKKPSSALVSLLSPLLVILITLLVV